MEDFGSALIPDFQQFYNLRLVDAVKNYSELELYYLIIGLPGSSRFRGRILGEKTRQGFGELEYLLLDIRNELATLRAFYAQANSKKGKAGEAGKLEPYSGIPGLDQMKKRDRETKLRRLHDSIVAKNIKTI